MKSKVTTITASQIYPIALYSVNKFTSTLRPSAFRRAFDTHLSKEDLAMDAVEKVVRANPLYLTGAYVRMAARCVCIDLMHRKRLDQLEYNAGISPEGEDLEIPDLEATVEGDSYDHLGDLEEFLIETFSEQELKVYKGLQSRKMYIEIAQDIGLSLRTFERQVRDLKWKITYILKEEEPVY